LKGAAEINTSDSARAKAASILHDGLTGVEPEFCMKAIKNVRLTTYGDNLQFFGLDPSYKGVTGKELYEKMTTVYGKLNLAQNPEPYDQIVDLEFIKSLGLENDKAQAAAKPVAFSAPTVKVQQSAAVASKPVRVTFATNSSTLDENAKEIINMMFVEQAKAFPTQHLRIIGNTDNTGNAEVNKRISAARAKSVVDYLVTQGFERNRFAPINGVGVGPENPLCTEDTEPCRAKNRRTDFQILED
jgi:NitT/TauT family transport system substrate-binding protein